MAYILKAGIVKCTTATHKISNQYKTKKLSQLAYTVAKSYKKETKT